MRLVRIAGVAGILTVLLAGPVAAGNSADLVVGKLDSPDPVVAGSNVTYTINVQNLGPNDATGVSMSDPLPAQMTFVSLTGPGGWTLTTPAVGANGTVSATLPTLTVAAGVQSFTLVVNVGAATPGGTVITNVASVASNVFDPTPGNNNSANQTTVTAPAASNLPNAAMPEPTTGSPLVFLGFGALLVSVLTTAAVLNRRRYPSA